MIVEDDPFLSLLFAHALQDINYETEVITDGRYALERLRAAPPALLLLDLHLPFLSGADILEAIKQDGRFAHTKIMLVTADIPMSMQLHDEADHTVHKPVDIFHLQRLANRLKPPLEDL